MIEIPHWPFKTPLQAGHWRWIERTEKPGDPPIGVIKMTCPQCGTEADLSRHEIDADGIVKPSVDCPRCEFHSYVGLADYSDVQRPDRPS